MKNPFPGLNPYLQHRWQAAHSRLIVYLCDQILPRLPDGLSATIEEGVSIDLDSPKVDFRPDVHVSESWDAPDEFGAEQSGGVAVVAPPPEPIVVKHKAPPRKQRHIEILETKSGDRVVSVIEILSPSNKRFGGGAEAYLTKQRELLTAGVNLVEIDFIRGFNWTPAFGWDELGNIHQPETFAGVTRAADTSQTEFYPFNLREPLPNIPLPLRPADRDLILQLQLAMDLVVENSGLRSQHYSEAPTPPLAPVDQDWVNELVAKS
ncbi:MAG: hypothetical protein ACI8UO_000926 [Verrucomicrobiales bacterium]|jgi:hypothetical protein